MKNQVSLLILTCLMVALAKPAWSGHGEDEKSSRIAPKNSSKISSKKKNSLVKEATDHRYIKSQWELKWSHKPSLEERISLLEKKAHDGDMKSQWGLVKIYVREVKDNRGEPDWKNACPWLVMLAKQNHPKAEFNLGYYYEKIMKNEELAREWYIFAAIDGHPKAQLDLGLDSREAYKSKNAVEMKQTRDEMIYWLTSAADQRYATAHFALALIYKDGDGNEQGNPEMNKSLSWLQAGADLGHRICQSLIGIYYERGDWLPQDSQKSIHYTTLAANQGCASAQFNLGRAHKLGLTNASNTPEWDKAIFWFTTAAHNGDSSAQRELGSYYLGEVEQTPVQFSVDIARAGQWYKLAAAKGDRTAQEVLQSIDTWRQ